MSHPYNGLNELREMFLKFFETKGHLRLPSFSLVPQNDKSILLINAGMTPMKPWFKGEEEPPCHRVCTCQKCIRTGDIDNVGKTARHGTYFEMLGNFSFGDYFKHEAIAWSWEFLTSPQWVGLEADRLYPSIYLDDDEAFDIWNKEIGIPKERIFRFGKEDNFWEHGSGPCGPCSEIYYDRGPEFGCGKPGCTVGCDCDRYIEIWNNVFSQFDNDGQGHYTELKQKNIDTGMGLERLACVCQNVESLFDVDTVMNITHKVSELTGAHYGETEKRDVSLRVITDHIRSATFMICDGILPSNEGRGYVLRRLLRRAARHGKLLGVNDSFLYQVVDTVIHENQGQYPDLREKQTYITKVIRTEEENFGRTIDGGMKIFSDLLAEHQAKGEKVFSGADAFRLYDTFGFPIDLTAEMVAEQLAYAAVPNEEIARAFDKTFSSPESDMVVVKDISLFSHCEHHIALMYNMKAAVGYIPRGRVIGLSKIARIADAVSKRLQIQERIGADIRDIMERITGAGDVIVLLEGEHSCMTARGIRKPGTLTRTISASGRFRADGDLRKEFLSMAK